MFRTLTEFKILTRGFFAVFVYSLLFLSACNSDKREVKPGFYHWKTSLAIDATERQYMQQLGSQQLYIRLFDVVWGANGPDYTPALQMDSSLPPNWRLVPVIFITNRCMLNASDAQIKDLAKNLIQRIQTTQLRNNWKVDEVQLDCDWSLKSKQRYFDLLKAFKAQSNWQVSATIRLHQVKYADKTGTPPVDRGLLMFYNMGDLRNPEEQNSILDIETAKKYLYNFEKYDLPLDVALPLFSWGVQLRYDQAVNLIEGLRSTDLTDTRLYLKTEYPYFQVLKDHYLKGNYVYKGDVLRVEEVTLANLEQAAILLAPQLPTEDSLRLLFYHLDSSLIKNYQHEALRSIVEHFE